MISQSNSARIQKSVLSQLPYGLTYDDLNLYSTWDSRNEWSCRLDDGKVIRCLGTRDDDKYKKGRRWFCVLHYWMGKWGQIRVALI